ncbi:ribonuclease III domain-containing protein [Mycena vulgaris]|nr:ribonuclease III domain-containing protein [Mycena vulgaris]
MSFQPYFGVDSWHFPPLPKILKEVIRPRVFTHRRYYARPTHVFEDRPDDPSPDNEKFAHLGDSVLGVVVTSLMLEMYTGLRVGPSTKVRAIIVGNATLAEISVKYKLPEQLRLHPAQAVTLCASTNVQADVFKSFISGLYTDQGLGCAAYNIVRVQHGLTPVGTPDPAACLPSPAPSPPLPTDFTVEHLALVNQQLQKGDQRVKWVYSDQHLFGMEAAGGARAGGSLDAFALRRNKSGDRLLAVKFTWPCPSFVPQLRTDPYFSGLDPTTWGDRDRLIEARDGQMLISTLPELLDPVYMRERGDRDAWTRPVKENVVVRTGVDMRGIQFIVVI